MAMILEEPYRVFFGLGVLVGMVGVLMWPAFHAGWMMRYRVSILVAIADIGDWPVSVS